MAGECRRKRDEDDIAMKLILEETRSRGAAWLWFVKEREKKRDWRERERNRERVGIFFATAAMLKTFSLGAVAYKGVGVQTQGI